MSGPGVFYKDLSPLPDGVRPVPDTEERKLVNTVAEAATASHALAVADPDEKGAAQTEHEEEIKDLGWNEPEAKRPKPLVGGLPNEELWILVRRFNKQMYHVKEVPHPVPGDLDLNTTEEEEFSPDKLRSNVERLYMTVVISLIAFGKQIARLRSWRESRRTSWFCTAYFLAWVLDCLAPLFSAFLITLIAYPPARGFLFPPAPIALVDSRTGGVQKPKAGVLGSDDSVTGAPENHKGEAVEAEASNFVSGLASVTLTSVAGKHPQGELPADEDSAQDSVPDPTALAVGAANAKDRAEGGRPTTKHDKTKVPMETAMWTKMRPFMHGIASVADTWERLGNALSPTPPFPKDTYRLRLAALLLPFFTMSVFVTPYMLIKGVTFGVGFGFFGDPIIRRGLEWLNRNYPNWQKLLEIRNTILKGAPTNAQLTITLLRIGEANMAPLPPPPRAPEPPPEEPVEVSEENLRAAGADFPLNATKEELDEAMSHDPAIPHETGGLDIDAAKSQKHGKRGSKLLNFFKGTTRATVNTAIGADRLKAATGSGPAKQRLGAIPQPGDDLTSGPVEFKCRYHGTKGHVYITMREVTPCVEFGAGKWLRGVGTAGHDNLHPVWSVPIPDIKELKKIGGYGWKAKLVVGWALDRQVVDGLEILDRKGNRWMVMACPLRDELFNRLVSMGGQKWESW